MNFFKAKQDTSNIENILGNDAVKHLVDTFIKGDMQAATKMIIIYEIPKGHKHETFWESAGYETAQAILSLDQLHHRIQHEGLNNND